MEDLWTDDLLGRFYQVLSRGVQHRGNTGFTRIYNAWEMPHFRIVFHQCQHVRSRDVDAAIVLGYINSDNNRKAIEVALRRHIPVLLCENGFISSAASRNDEKAAPRHRLEHSLMVDRLGQFFDSTRPTDLENMLNGGREVSKEQRDTARTLIDKILATKVTMFNHQPIYTPNIGREGKPKVLVVDQTFRDFSVTRGMGDEQTFKRMLQAACDENPDADIIVKTHPFVLEGRRGYYRDLQQQGHIHKVTFPVNPYSLLGICEKVYVCTSNMGFEALLAGKEVHTFGMPYYAGWGLTKDALHIDRRTRKRTVEELFYIFACKYTHWVDPERGCETTLDAVIDKMVAMRKEMGVREE